MIYMTPDSQVPLNNRPPGEIAGIAREQLMRYEEAAARWDIYADGNCNRCRKCGQNIWFSSDKSGRAYKYTAGEITCLITAHIRQVHDNEI